MGVGVGVGKGGQQLWAPSGETCLAVTIDLTHRRLGEVLLGALLAGEARLGPGPQVSCSDPLRHPDPGEPGSRLQSSSGGGGGAGQGAAAASPLPVAFCRALNVWELEEAREPHGAPWATAMCAVGAGQVGASPLGPLIPFARFHSDPEGV